MESRTVNQPVAEKQPYSTPRVIAYGDVREITRTTGSASPNPDPGAGKTKTA